MITTCSFFGHREIERTQALYDELALAIKNAIELGCRTFYFGGYGEFDELCYELTTKIKEERPSLGLKRIFCVARAEHLRKKNRYFCPEDYEDAVYLQPAFEGWYKSIYYRNLAMIDESWVVIFYAEKRKDSGAYKAYEYAVKSKDKKIVNLFKERS